VGAHAEKVCKIQKPEAKNSRECNDPVWQSNFAPSGGGPGTGRGDTTMSIRRRSQILAIQAAMDRALHFYGHASQLERAASGPIPLKSPAATRREGHLTLSPLQNQFGLQGSTLFQPRFDRDCIKVSRQQGFKLQATLIAFVSFRPDPWQRQISLRGEH
jgi:hypothetical protein